MFNQPQQTPADPEAVKNSQVFTIRIQHGAFLAGLVIFTIIAVVVGTGAEAEVDEAADQQALSTGIFWMVIGSLGVLALAGAALLPGIFARQARAAVSKTDPTASANSTPWAGPWYLLQLIRMSLLEGAGLFAAVALLISGDLLFLLPIAVFVGALVMVAPSRAKLDAFEALAKDGPPHPTAM